MPPAVSTRRGAPPLLLRANHTRLTLATPAAPSHNRHREAQRRYRMSAKHAEQTRLRKSSPAWRFQELRGGARRRGKSLSLAPSEYEGLVVDGRCFYCHGRCGSGLLGIDRVGNSRGYHPGNCVACWQIEHGADVACGVGKREEKMYDDPAIRVRVVPVHSGSKKRSFDEPADTRCATFPAREMPKNEDALCVAASAAPKGAPDVKHRWMKQWVRREEG